MPSASTPSVPPERPRSLKAPTSASVVVPQSGASFKRVYIRCIRSDNRFGARDQSSPAAPLILRSRTHRSTPLTASIELVTIKAGSPSKGNSAYPCAISGEAPGLTMYSFMSASIQMK